MTIINTVEYSEEKLKELVLYIATKSANDARFGMTRLQKTLFFSDFLAYQDHGKAITGTTYKKLPFGPFATVLPTLLEDMETQGDIQIVRDQKMGYIQQRVQALKPANLRLFSPDELGVIHNVLMAFTNKNSVQVSGLSHKFPGYIVAGERETIPYESVFLDIERTPSSRDIEWAQGLAAEYGESSVIQA